MGVVTWNTAELTARALRLLVDATGDVDLRILVHDNASTDGTVETLRREVPEAEVAVGQGNLGFAAGVNRLLARSTAPWFLALNSDAWPLPGAVSRLIGTAEQHPEAAIVVPRLERPDGTLEHSTFPFPSLPVAALTAVGGYRWVLPCLAERRLLPGAGDHDVARAVPWAVGAAMLLRRRAVDDVGPFDERFFMYAEDMEWCWRAGQRGWAIWFEPAARVCHVGNASGEQRFEGRRTVAHLHNAYRFHRRIHGSVSTTAHRALNVIGIARLYGLARLRGDRREARRWRAHLRGHLTRPVGDDRPTEPITR
ncbi:N/A [soil metagenome]